MPSLWEAYTIIQVTLELTKLQLGKHEYLYFTATVSTDEILDNVKISGFY